MIYPLLDQCLTGDDTFYPRGSYASRRPCLLLATDRTIPFGEHMFVTLREFARCKGENPDLTMIITGFESYTSTDCGRLHSVRSSRRTAAQAAEGSNLEHVYRETTG